MKALFLSLKSLVLLTFLSSFVFLEARPRTDGPPGSEYGSSSWLEGELQIGAYFGGLLDQDDSDQNSFLLGADVDYRPFDLFGARLSYIQSLQKPRSSLIHFSPVLHTAFSNLEPYVFGGPGIAIVEDKGRSAKFSILMGAGVDVVFAEFLGVGMLYSYDVILDSSDLHALLARISLRF